MNRLIIVSLILFWGYSCNGNRQKELVAMASSPASVPVDTCVDFDALNDKIRDQLISKEEALVQVQKLLPKLKAYFYGNGGQDFQKSNWVFPVQGYNTKAIGGINGSGYVAAGYDYFDGNKHGGHPAHDIFIFDKNQDCIDDITKKSVNVRSMTGGIVIATETVWDAASSLRGGKYIWVYDPLSNRLFYYAHNNEVLVKPCDILKPGDIIATVGRTGLNAFKKRSPTHLHMMQLSLDAHGYPRPVDCYNELVAAK